MDTPVPHIPIEGIEQIDCTLAASRAVGDRIFELLHLDRDDVTPEDILDLWDEWEKIHARLRDLRTREMMEFYWKGYVTAAVGAGRLDLIAARPEAEAAHTLLRAEMLIYRIPGTSH